LKEGDSLAGWSETSGAWRLYVKDVFESNIDSSGLIYSDLRIPERVKYLKNITSHYNFRLLAPEKNLETLQDCLDIAPKEWTEFCKSINKNCLNITFSDLENGKITSFCRYKFFTCTGYAN